MKKIFSLALCVAAMVTASAQLIISPTGMMDEVGMQAEAMSPDASSYVCGLNQMSLQPAIWNVATDDIVEFGGVDTIYQPLYAVIDSVWEYDYYDWNTGMIIDSVLLPEYDYETIIGYDSTIWDLNTYGGTFHAVTNSGLAVGEFGGAYGDKYAAKANFNDAEVTYLYSDTEFEAGSGAYAVNADGSIILGFYFDAAWTTHACVWKNGGLTAADRIDLPAPTEEQFGGPIDYVAARWMSEDASVILGYAQDEYNGSWVMIYWTLEADGNYAVHAEHANQYFTPYAYDENWNAYYVKPECPYSNFEPSALSANGEWVTLIVMEKVDKNDWDAMEISKAARLNLTTNELTVLDLGNYDAPILYGIANNGTAAGATEAGGVGPLSTLGESLSAERVGYVWFAGSDTIASLQQLFPSEEYFNYEAGMGEAAIAGISADASKIVGYTNQTDGVDTWVTSSFIVSLGTTAIENVSVENAKGVKMLKNGEVVIVRNGNRYNLQGAKL